jgi:hypothetical protein
MHTSLMKLLLRVLFPRQTTAWSITPKTEPEGKDQYQERYCSDEIPADGRKRVREQTHVHAEEAGQERQG